MTKAEEIGHLFAGMNVGVHAPKSGAEWSCRSCELGGFYGGLRICNKELKKACSRTSDAILFKVINRRGAVPISHIIKTLKSISEMESIHS